MFIKNFNLKFLFLALYFCSISGNSFTQTKSLPSPEFAIKTNLLMDAFSNINLGFEYKISNKFTIDIPVNYNPWTFSDNKKFKNLIVQPELRYWLCETFYGTSIGLHIHGGAFNAGGLNLPIVKNLADIAEHRYEGYLYGGGLSINHHFILSDKFSLETNIGAGYSHIIYDKFKCKTCGKKESSGNTGFFSPTKASISLLYLIK
jgi:hypothetical protein